MMIWAAFAVLTALATLAVLVPLARAGRAAPAAADHDKEVYRAQLEELERDVERGVIAAEAAEAARTEIARRLIAAAREPSDAGTTVADSRLHRVVQVGAVLLIPLGAIALYLGLGAPDLPDQPLAARLSAPAAEQDVALLISRVEQHLAENPDDAAGWQVLAPVYLRVGRAEEAAEAYRTIIRLLGSTAARETDLGEALTAASGGTVGPEARAAFERAVALDPRAVKPRFFLALGLGQAGESEAAIAAWRALLADASGSEPWVPVARAQLARLEEGEGTPAPGPSSEDIEAAGELSAEDRGAMIAGMVERLDSRLSSEGGTVEDWLRLIRAYGVLGEKDRLQDAVRRADAAFAGNSQAQARIRTLAEELGAGS